jgi:hypothetical protein
VNSKKPPGWGLNCGRGGKRGGGKVIFYLEEVVLFVDNIVARPFGRGCLTGYRWVVNFVTRERW